MNTADNNSVMINGSQDDTGMPPISALAIEGALGAGPNASISGETLVKPGIILGKNHRAKKAAMGTAITPPDDSKKVPIISVKVNQKKVWTAITKIPARKLNGESQPSDDRMPMIK